MAFACYGTGVTSLAAGWADSGMGKWIRTISLKIRWVKCWKRVGRAWVPASLKRSTHNCTKWSEVRIVWYWPHIFSRLVFIALAVDWKAFSNCWKIGVNKSSNLSLFSFLCIHNRSWLALCLEDFTRGEKLSSSRVEVTTFLSKSWASDAIK